MTVFQKGDKVRDVNVGTVHHASHDGVIVAFPDNPNYHTVWMPDRLELIERPTPPVKVGDTVTEQSVASLPTNTIVVNEDGEGFQRRYDGVWDLASAADFTYKDRDVVNTTVVYLP